MSNDLIQFFLDHVGDYTTPTYEVTEKIVNTTTGAVETWTYNVIPNGLAGLDIAYITRYILLIMILNILYKTIKWTFTIFGNVSNPSRRKIDLK